MKKYKVPTLTSKTSQADQSKLVTALNAVHGVESAILHVGSSEFEIKNHEKQEPKREDIASAAAKAGFTVSAS